VNIFCSLFIVFSLGFLCAAPINAAEAVAEIKPTLAGSPIAGEAVFEEKNGGLDVAVTLVNVTPGKHGFHIHENGSCDDEGKAAGSHFNPDAVAHGMASKDGFEHAHAGDFGNIEIDADGFGTLDFFMPGLTLTDMNSKYNVVGRAVIVHEKEDDFGQPLGNAGGRIACGIIGLVDMSAQTTIGEPAQ